MSTTAPRVPVIDGWFVTEPEPRLLGLRDTATGTYVFPRDTAVSRPPLAGDPQFEEVELSNVGTLWSYTTNHYEPPSPYVSPDPFVPYTVCAVELADEQMVILGQLADGIDPADITVGDEMRLVIETLFTDEDGEHLVWRWTPNTGGAA